MENSVRHSETKKHTVQIDCRNHAAITGVTEVYSFHETEVVLKIDSGIMFLSGHGMHIGKLLLDEGKVDVEGQIDGITYENKKEKKRRNFWRGMVEK